MRICFHLIFLDRRYLLDVFAALHRCHVALHRLHRLSHHLEYLRRELISLADLRDNVRDCLRAVQEQLKLLLAYDRLAHLFNEALVLVIELVSVLVQNIALEVLI